MWLGFSRAREMVDLTAFIVIAGLNSRQDRRLWDRWCETCRAERTGAAYPTNGTSAAGAKASTSPPAPGENQGEDIGAVTAHLSGARFRQNTHRSAGRRFHAGA